MQKMEWGKGLAQREDVEAKKAELAKMAHRPFARCALSTRGLGDR